MKEPEKTDVKKVFENRDLSWLRFNARVLEEADHMDNPLLERANFTSIVTANLDEFFQVRYHTIFEKKEKKKSCRKLYEKVNSRIFKQVRTQYNLYDGIISELYGQGIQLFPSFSRSHSQIKKEDQLFAEIQPQIKSTFFEPDRLCQKQLHLLVKLARRKADPFRIISVPTSIPRVFVLSEEGESPCLIRVEDILKHHLQALFPHDIVEFAFFFRFLRNQDFEVKEQLRDDILPAVQEMLAKRPSGKVMRLEVEEGMSEEMLTLLMKGFHIGCDQVFRAPGPVDLNKLLSAICKAGKQRTDLKYTSAEPLVLPELMGDDLFEKISEKDRLLFHPYHSFSPVVHFLDLAAADPSVTAIKQTLYRVSDDSPIVAALETAARNGKDVQVLFEAHARFDEENNLLCAERLQRAGCTVLYGLPNMKIHSKITFVESRQEGSLRRWIHLGTGNYNEGTAKLYTDFSLLTADPILCEDASAFFEQFDGEEAHLSELIQAPDALKPTLSSLIEAERAAAREGCPAHILAKMNSINDPIIMKELIEASRDGVKIDLLVRGLCCLIPGMKDLTENIRVRSIVGRNLEHARAFVFENRGEHLIYLSSADWMERNLYKRVELMFPIKDPDCRQAVENVLRLQWNDTEKCRRRKKNGKYLLKENGTLNAQEIFYQDIEGVFAGTNEALSTVPLLFEKKKKKALIEETLPFDEHDYVEEEDDLLPEVSQN